MRSKWRDPLRMFQWHRWFAWRPVAVERYPSKFGSERMTVWLEFVERRRFCWLVCNWEYRLPGEGEKRETHTGAGVVGRQ